MTLHSVSQEVKRIHGKTEDGWDIVRYKLASKWFLEKGSFKKPITVKEAAEHAFAGTYIAGVPGGRRLDQLVRKLGR